MRRFLPLLALAACVLQLAACDFFLSAEDRMARAEARIAAADDRGALIELQNAVRADQGNVRARLMLTEISLRLGNAELARKELTEAIAHGATPQQTADVSARISLAAGEYVQLLRQLDAAGSPWAEPQHSLYRGLALIYLNRLAEGRQTLTAAVASHPQAVEVRLALAEVMANQAESEEALTQIQAVLDAEPANASAWFLRGKVLAAQGEFEGATASLEKARDNAAGQLSLGQVASVLAGLCETNLALGKLEVAKQHHAELLKRAPDSAFAGLLASRIALSEHNYSVAVAEAQKVVTALPNLVQAKLLLGSALLAQGNLNQAEAQLTDVMQQAPDNLEARKLLARIQLQLQRPDIAVQVLSAAQQAEDPQLDALLGRANLQRGDNAAAISLLERGVAAQPANVELKLELAAAYMADGQPAKALELLQSVPASTASPQRDALLVGAIEAVRGPGAATAEVSRMVAASPKNIAVLNVAASFHVRHSAYEEARQLLARAIQVDPSDVNTAVDLARVEAALGRNDDALATLDRAQKVNPNSAVIGLASAEVLWMAGRVDEAIGRAEKIAGNDPKSIEARLALAKYRQAANPQLAERHLREARSLAENNASAMNTVAAAFIDRGRFDEALSAFRHSARLDPNNVTYLLNIARAQIALDNRAAARETLNQVIAVRPTSVPAHAMLTMLDLKEGRRDQAMQRVKALREARPGNAIVAALEGDVAMMLKTYADAERAYSEAQQLQPSAAFAIRIHRARQLGGLPNALQPLEQWLKRTPNDAAARLVLAEGYLREGNRGRAVEQYEIAARAERPNPMALNNLAWLYQEAGDERALQVAERAYKIDPRVPAIADTYGWILVEKRQIKDALPILQRAAADSGSAEIRYHLAVALERDGQRDAARKELLEVTRSGAKYPSADAAQRLLTQLGE